MPITVRTGAALKKLFMGKQEVEAMGDTIRQLLENLGVRDRLCDDTGKIRHHFNIHINDGEDIRLINGLDTPVKDGDTVTILSAIAGGTGVIRRFWLTFTKNINIKSLISEIIQNSGVEANLGKLSSSKDISLIGLKLSGEEADIRKTVDLIMNKGISIEPVELDIVE